MPTTMRYKLTIAYRGTHYHGWQAQTRPAKGPGPPLATVQGAVSRALGYVLSHPVVVVGSSRTDAGVHAKGQVAHFDTPKTQVPPDGLRRACNAQLPGDILVKTIEPVPDSFNARFGTVSKRYQYFIWHSPERPVMFADLAWHRWQDLDRKAMDQAARHFEGEHDFVSFTRPGHGRLTTVRHIWESRVSWRGPAVVVSVHGSGFMWNQVRIMVGTIVEVGLGLRSADEIPVILRAADRRAAGATAPAHGLYLQRIHYGVSPGEGQEDACVGPTLLDTAESTGCQ